MSKKIDRVNDLEALLSVEQIADFFGVHPKTVYRSKKRFGARKIPGVGVRARREDVERIALQARMGS